MAFDVREYIKQQSQNTTNNSNSESFNVQEYIKQTSLPQVGEYLSSSINNWLKKNESFYAGYNSRVGRYQDKDVLDWAYESDSSDWLSSLTTQKGDLENEAKEIRTWLDTYKDYLDQDYYSSATKALDGNLNQYEGIISYATDINKHWSQWETEDAYKEWVGQQVDYNEKLNYDLEAGEIEIGEIESRYNKALEISNKLQSLTRDISYGYTRAGYNREGVEEKVANDPRIIALRNELAQYGDPSELASALSEKKAYYTLAERVQKAAELASVADVESENYDPAFTEKSQYQSTSHGDDTSFWDKLFKNEMGMGYADLTHEYINGDEEFRSSVNQKHSMWTFGNNPGGDTESRFEDAGYDFMNEEEIAIYNYYYNTEGKEKAQEYLDSIRESLQYRYGKDIALGYKGNPVGQYIFAVESGLEQFVTGVAGMFADEYIPTSSTQIASGMIREDLADTGAKLPDWLGGGSLGQVGYDVLNTTSNMLPSILASTAVNLVAPGAGAVVGAGLMGASAGGNAKLEMLNLGYSKEQANTYGLMVGVAEAGMEYLLGGISKLGGKASGGLTELILSKVDNAFARTAIKIGGSMASEGFEEGLQTVIEPWLKEVATGVDWDDPNIDEVLYSSLLGALSAFGLEGAGTVAGEVNTYKSGKQVQNVYAGVEKLQNLGQTFSADTVAYKIASKVNAQTDAYTIGRLLNEVGGTISEQNMTDIVNGLTAKGIRKSDATKIARQYQSILNSEMNISDEQVKILENLSPLADVLRTNIIGSNTTVYQRTRAYSDLMSLADEVSNGKKDKATKTEPTEKTSATETAPISIFEQNDINTELQKIASEVATGARTSSAAQALKRQVDSASETAADRLGVEGRYTSSETGATRLASNKKKVNVVGVDSIKDGTLKLKLNDGTIVDADEIDFSTSDEALVYEAVANMGVNATTAWEILKGYNPKSNQKGTIYAMGALEAYTYGHNGVKVDGMSKDGFSALLSPTQQNTANRLGDIDARAKVEAKQKTIDKAVKSVRDEAKSKHKAIPLRNGQVVFEGKHSTLTDLQEKQIDVLGKVSEGLGVTFHLFESDDNFKYTMPDGAVRSANGWYDTKTGEIWIDLKAGNVGQGTIIFTAAHELTHFIKQWSPAKFKIFADFLFEQYGKKGQDVNQLIQRQIEKAAAKNRTLGWEEAYEEVVADSCETFLRDSKAAEKIAALREKDTGLANKIKSFLGQMLAKMRKVMADAKLLPETTEGQIVSEMTDSLQKLYDLWTDALADAGKAYSTLANIDFDTDSVAPMLSERTWTASEYVTEREETAKKISKALGVDMKTAYKYIDDINSVARLIADDRARLDYEPNLDEHATVLKPNSDYKYSVDMSTLCAKRLLFTGTFDAIQRALPNTVFDSEDIVALREMMQKRGYEVACGICYVESTRREIGRITQEFIDRYKEAQKTGKPITRINSEGKAVDLKKTKDQMETTADKSADKFYAEKDYTPTLADLNTTDIDIVKRDHPLVYEAYLNFMNARGQAKPKLLETRAEYKGEILKHFKYKSAVNARNNAGGLRLQSFSDFEVPHLIDMMQIVMDMSRVGLKSQAYTKVPAFAEIFGDTGVKINLSLIAKGDGLDANGNLVFDDVEGINHNEAFKLRDKYSKNVGTILVGKTDAHIIAAMADSRIDYIIPFHKSSWKESLYDALGLTGYADYTDYQNEKPIDKSREIKNFDPSEYWDFSKSGDENAQIYLEKCREDGRIPKFPQFQGYPGYWKLLIDFKMYDNDGVGSPQEVVRPTFNMEASEKILSEYKGGHRNFPVAKDVVEDFVREHQDKVKLSDRGSDTKYSFREYTDKQKENWKDAKRIVLYENELQFRDFIDKARNDKTYNKKMYFGAIPSDLAALIQTETGINVENFNCSLSAYEIKKIFKDHGDEAKEVPRGQRAITEDDIFDIPTVILSADDITLSDKTYEGKPVIEFSKQTNGKLTVAAVVSDKHLDLFVQTAYAGIKKGNLATPIGEQAPINTPKASSGTVSNNRIPHLEDSVNRDTKEIFSDSDSLTPEQQKNFDYNQNQTSIGSTLKTLKGSSIKRSTKYGVGKEIGGEIYFHKDYADDILPPEVLSQAERLLDESHSDFEYNCLKYNPKTGVVAFQEAPDFDTAREPMVGDYVSVNTNTGEVKTGHSNYIWHHKWNWVKNNYTGFDVEKSWEWSKRWLSTLTEVSDGNGIERWQRQLDKFNLPHDGVKFSERKQEFDSKDTSIKILPATFTKFGLKSTDRVLDWGGGQYDIAKKAVEHGYPGIKFEVVDAFNRTPTHNERVLKEYTENPATVLTINNVLNVIKETDIIEDVIQESKKYLAEGGVCYIKIHEGSAPDAKTGVGKVTSSGWQNNQPAEWYKQFAEKYYRYVERSGDILIASDSPIDKKTLPKASTETADVMRNKVREIAKTEGSQRDVMYSDRVLMGSLFSGGGTFEAGLVYQMLDKEFAVEYNKKIAATYTDNHGKEHMFVGDVRDFNSKEKQNVFYLHASPVCKNFSPASHSGGETTLDITTAQATARVLEEQMPQVFTVENVKRYIGSEAYNIITKKLDELGYTWDVAVYKASDYGNATKRERMIIRAVKDGQLPAKPQKASNITSWGEATRDLWETDLIPSTLVRSKIEAIKNTPQLKGVKLTKLDKPLLIYDTTKSKTVSFAWADELAPTLTTKCGDARIIMPDGRVYAPTPRFMGRIQGLPDDYKYPQAATNAFKIIGNGIPTQLTKAVMGGVLDSAYEQTHDGQVLYSDRSPSSVSTRSLLANALETTAQNDIEKNKLAQYKSKLALIEKEQARLSEVKRQANEIRFTKGRTATETKRMKALDFEANEIANRINTYDRQLFNLESTTALKNVLQREKELARRKEAKKGKEALARQKEKEAKTVRTLMDKNTESRKKAIERRDKTEMRGKIKKVVGDLKALLLDPTKDKHVPIGLQKPVAEALDIINMDTVGADERIAKYNDMIHKAKDPDIIAELTKSRDRIALQGESLSDKLTALKLAYAEIKNSDDPLIKGSHDESIETLIHNTAITVGETSLRDMSYEQLEAVYDMYKAILAKVRNANKMFKEGKQETITANSEWTKREISAVGGHRNRVLKATKFLKKFGWNMLKPIYAMKLIGSDTLTRLYENVRKGEDTWAVDVNEAKDFFRETAKKYEYNTWDFKKPYKFTDSAGHSFSLTLEQIMSLYAYSKRKQADKHLELGGFIFDDSIEVTESFKLGKINIPMKYEVNDANPYRLKKEDLGKIIGILETDLNNVKKFVDEMQAYLSDVMGAKGNEVSLAMYDIKLYKEENYFPLKSAKYFREFDPEKNGTPKIKNSSFSKKTVPQAGNPIVLANFMDVWANHVNDMSMYHAFVLPLEDFMRVYNYSSTAGGYDSVQQYIKNAYGAQANSYIETLMNDLNGGARTDPAADIFSKGISLFKKAAVFASASVVIQQPSAIARALAYIDAKYFVDKPEITKHSETWAEVKKYAPVAIIKEMGYFDTGMGQSTIEWIKEDKTWRDKVDDIASKAPALADELAWCGIWKAVKREVADSTNLKVGSEEFLKMAGKRFTEVVTKTQVYDSVLSRSAMMRSKDTGMKMATAFMAEPTTSLNMVIDAIIEGKRGNKKFAKRAVGAVAASVILNSILVSLVYAARDDDEDETYTEKYLESLTAELLDGFNPITYIPFAKDVWSIAQGFDIERSDMSVVADFWESIENLFNDNKSGFEKVEGVTGSVASLFGLPLKNVLRDARGIYNFVTTLLSGTPTTKARVGEAIGGAVKNSIPLYSRIEKWVGANDSKSDKLYDAIISGDQSHIDRVKSQYKDDKAIESAIRQGLRDNDSRIKEAAKAHASGDIRSYSDFIDTIVAEGHFDEATVKSAILSEESYFIGKINEAAEAKNNGDDTEYKKIVRELRDSYRGIYSQDKIVNLVKKAQDEQLKTKDDEDVEEETSIYKASDVNSAFESGDTEMALEVIEDLINTKVTNYLAEAKKEAEESGKRFNERTAQKEAETKAKSSIRSSMTSYWKPLYKEAYKSKNTAEQERIKMILKASGLYGNASEVIKTCREWRTERD